MNGRPFAEILPTPPHIGTGHPRRFHPPVFFNECFGGFFPGACGSGFGFFFGSPFWGPGCDPFWSWGCSGFWLGYDYGPGYGPGYNNNYGDTDSYGGGSQFNLQADTMGSPQESGPFTSQNSPAENSGAGAPAPVTVTMLYFRDGSSYGVTDYWLAEGNLHYVTTYGGQNSVRADQLDLQRTVDENARNGVDFVLHPAPPPAAPQP